MSAPTQMPLPLPPMQAHVAVQSNTLATMPATAMLAPQEQNKSVVSARAFSSPGIQAGPTKLFVGSIPLGITEWELQDEFGKFGPVAEVFLKNDATEPSRMWGFVTFVHPEHAATAAASLNDTFAFPGATRPLAVSFARGSMSDGLCALPVAPLPAVASGMPGPTKLFVGSIPEGTTRGLMKDEFEKFGAVVDIFLKADCTEHGRMWGFVTYADSSAAAAAVTALHERLVLPGGSRPCAVSFARNSQAQHSMAAANVAQAVVSPSAGQTKLFIGTIPVGTTEQVLRVEFERYGQVTEIFLKNDSSDPQRMWGFLNYADPQSAAVAVSALHEKLMLPGSQRPCAVSYARSGSALASPPVMLPQAMAPPAGNWKVYYTAQGLPYYHNEFSGVTQWECPPELGGSSSDLANLLATQGMANARLPLTGGDANNVPLLVGETHRYSPY